MRPAKRLGGSVGPETRNARPSAIHFKEKIWRPVAALAVALLAGIVYVEDHPQVNDRQVSANQTLKIKLADQYLDSIPSESKSETSLSGSFLVSDLIENKRVLESQIQIVPSKVSNRQQSSHAQITSAQIPQVPIAHSSPPPETISIAGEISKLSPITGYYCEQVPGYPIWDGGKWCHGTASGEEPRLGSAACGDKWPLWKNDKSHTILFIEGYGEVECLDRGQLEYDQVDVWFDTNKRLAEANPPFPFKAKVTEVEK